MTSVRLLAKRALALPARAARVARRVPTRWVLTFHEVGDHPWAVPSLRFQAILEALRAEVAVVPLAELVNAPPDGGVRAAITFDDGYLGVAVGALPMLEKAGLAATVFLPTDLLPETDGPPRLDRGLYRDAPLMGWRTVERLAASSVLRFESHGAGHLAMRSLAAEVCRDDLVRSREAIASRLGAPPRFLAYPFGSADGPAATCAREVGFEAAFTTRHGGLRAAADPFRLPRVDIRGDYAPKDVLAILRGDWDFLAWSQAIRGTRA